MGKQAAGTTTTYKYYIYYAGFHMVLCHTAEVTRLLKFQVDDLDVYSGDLTAPSNLEINLPELFGGKDSEGGIFGTFTILDGNWAQGVNEYLGYRAGYPCPGYRGVVSFISNHCALQYNNPYLKDPTLKVICLHANWRTDVREIGFVETYYETVRYPTNEGQCTWDRWAYRECVLVNYVDPPTSWVSSAELADPNTIDSGVGYWLVPVYDENGGQSGYTPKFTPPATPADAEMEADWRLECDYFAVEVPPDSGIYELQYICAWHCLREFTFNEYVASITSASYVEVQEKRTRIQPAGTNPVHIVYSVLTNPFWGKGLPTSELDLVNFSAVADVLYSEGFALSLSWAKQTSIEDFLQLVMDHIGGILVRPITTNKYTLKLLRPGEAPSFELLAEHIVRIEEYEEAGWAGATNEYTVKYCDVLDGKDKSVTVHDLAAFERQLGIPVTESKEYLGLPTFELAERVAWRDLMFVTVPIRKMTVVTDRVTYAVSPGDVIAVNWPPYGLDGVSFRVVEVDYGTPTSNEITLSLITDPYVTNIPVTQAPPAVVIRPPIPPLPAQPELLYEAPYWHVKLYQESNGFPSELLYPYSFLVVLGGNPQSNGSQVKSLFKQNALAEVAGSAASFCGALKLRFPIHRTSTELFLDPGYRKNLEKFTVGSLAYIGTAELVEVVSLNLATMVLTVHRGILDTLPKIHAAGTYVVSFNANELARSYATWLAGDAAKAWVLTQATTGTLTQAEATELSLTVAGRQGRPIAPGGLSIGGSYLSKEFTGSFLAVWEHRNRLTQTAPTFIHQTDASLIPEGGVEYPFVIYDEAGIELLAGTATEAGGELQITSPLTIYEHDAAAEVTLVGTTAALSTTTGDAHTGAGFVSDNEFSSAHTTELSFSWKYTGIRYPVSPMQVYLCGDPPSREGYYGLVTNGIGVQIVGALEGWLSSYGVGYGESYIVSNTLDWDPATDTEYVFNLVLNWDSNTYELRLDGELKQSGEIPVAYQDQHTSYRVSVMFPNYESVSVVTLTDFMVISDGSTVFIAGEAMGIAIAWNGITLSAADELMVSGRLNNKLRLVVSATRDGLTSIDSWDHTTHRVSDSLALPLVNADFATGDLTSWTTLAGAPMARAVAELGFDSCGASSYAIGNSVAGLANQWAAYQEVDLLEVLYQDRLDNGFALLELTVEYRATEANAYGTVYVEFFDVGEASLGVDSSGAFSIPTTSLGTKTLQVFVPPDSRYARLVLSCSSTSANVTGFFGCVAGAVKFLTATEAYDFESTQAVVNGTYAASFAADVVTLSAPGSNANTRGSNLEARFEIPAGAIGLAIDFKRDQNGTWYDDDFTDAQFIVYVVPGADHGEASYDTAALGYNNVIGDRAGFAVKKAVGELLTHYSSYTSTAEHIAVTTGPWDGATSTLTLKLLKEHVTGYMLLEMWEGETLLSTLSTDEPFPVDGLIVFHWHNLNNAGSEILNAVSAAYTL